MKEITLADMVGEIKDMLSVCFEGKILEQNACICMILPDGQQFSVLVQEEAA